MGEVRVLFTGLLALYETTDPLDGRPCMDARYVEGVDGHKLRIIAVANPPFIPGSGVDQPLLPVYIPGSTTTLGQFIRLDNRGNAEIGGFPPPDTVVVDSTEYNGPGALPDLNGVLVPAFRVFNCHFRPDEQQTAGPYRRTKGGADDGSAPRVVQTFVAVMNPLPGSKTTLSGPGLDSLALNEDRDWTVYVTCLAPYSDYARAGSVKRSDFPHFYKAFPTVPFSQRYNFHHEMGLAPEVPCLPIGLNKYEGQG